MTSFVTVFSQTKNYKGYVLDSATKEPLVGATVFISREIGTITDINGLFTLKVPDSAAYRVVISYTGYASRHVVLDESYWNDYKFNLKSVDTVFLAENFIIFDQVVVTAGRTDQKLTSVTVSMEVIKPYLLENRNNVSLDDAIDQVPSVSFTDG
ncbi:MAG TPA: carboxypeptidase-like regulatory domain-containing protein, partial [Bacteroidia bacterium]|nr:carboxypeptidase-like regulatory domain-containing protein [Bacteroidia bacterium]